LDRRKEQPDHHADDRDHDQEFDERECRSAQTIEATLMGTLVFMGTLMGSKRVTALATGVAGDKAGARHDSRLSIKDGAEEREGANRSRDEKLGGTTQ
jgi:hypothetical protein